MNTGNQRSSTTPKGAWTTTTPSGMTHRGKRNEAKNLPLILAWHGISYVATATVGFLEDYAGKLGKAKSVREGMSYIHLLTPCPLGWKIETDRVLEVSRLAVQTNYFPLWEMQEGRFRLTHCPTRRKPIEKFTKLQGRFRHFTGDLLDEFQENVDYKFKKIKALSEISDSA
jgi:pyruvate/2-oxoacid:ferredoxin oxidoreductase beta subunit